MVQIEPRADFRAAAKLVYEAYQALLQAGFNEHQALQLTMAVMRQQPEDKEG